MFDLLEKFNFWDGAVTGCGVARPRYMALLGKALFSDNESRERNGLRSCNQRENLKNFEGKETKYMRENERENVEKSEKTSDSEALRTV